MEWISVKEDLPKVCENVLLIDNVKDIYIGFLSEYSHEFMCFCNCREGSYINTVTHWMPLPPKII